MAETYPRVCAIIPVVRDALDNALEHTVWLTRRERATIVTFLAGPSYREGKLPEVVREVLLHARTYHRECTGMTPAKRHEIEAFLDASAKPVAEG